MADQLYLSLWFPNFRLESLQPALVSVIEQFAAAGAEPRVHAATAYPLTWNESPAYQRVYRPEEEEASQPRAAVAEATEPLKDDFAYEFEIKWNLWVAELGGGLDPSWKEEPRVVRVVGFGPLFDEGTYEQNGHVRVDFGMDTPFLEDDLELDQFAASRVERNLQKLVAFTNAVQQNCAISSRLLWSESGENLAQKLIARLQRLN